MMRRSPSLKSVTLATNFSGIGATLFCTLNLDSRLRGNERTLARPSSRGDLRDLVGERADALYPDFDHVARFEEFARFCAGSGRRPSEDQVAGMKRHVLRKVCDLL